MAISVRGSLCVGCMIVLGGCLGPRETLDAALEAGNRGDWSQAEAHFVTPELLGELVDCGDSTESGWLLPENRRAWLDDERDQTLVDGAPLARTQVKVGSFEAKDVEENWKKYAAGDVVHGECKARRAFATEDYRVEFQITEYVDDLRRHTMPITFWRVGRNYYLWDAPAR